MSAFVELVSSIKTSDEDIPRIPWSELAPAVVYDSDPGKHMIVLGQTGSGKTTVVFDFLNRCADVRDSYVCAIGTKMRDETLVESGWPVIRAWPPKFEDVEPGHRIVLWPYYHSASQAPLHTKQVLSDALDEMMREGNWRIFIDEMAYFVKQLSMSSIIDEFSNGARSSGISLVAGTQRPRIVSRSTLSQSEFILVFYMDDEDDRKRAAEVLGDRTLYTPKIREISKPKHEFLIVHQGIAAISWIDYAPGKYHQQKNNPGKGSFGRSGDGSTPQ